MELAGGQVQDASKQLEATVQLQRYSDSVSFQVTQLSPYDLVLGKPWLHDNNPRIDWKDNTVKLWREGRAVTIHATSTAKRRTRQQISTLCTPKQLKQLRRKKGNTIYYGEVTYLGHPPSPKKRDGEGASVTARVTHTEHGPWREEIFAIDDEETTTTKRHGDSRRYERIADEYGDVFEEPTGQPPKRHVEHRIELEPGSTPPFRPIIRMSPAELEEARKQIKEFTEKTHVRRSKSPYSAPAIFVKKKGWRTANVHRLPRTQQADHQGSLSYAEDRRATGPTRRSKGLH